MNDVCGRRPVDGDAGRAFFIPHPWQVVPRALTTAFEPPWNALHMASGNATPRRAEFCQTLASLEDWAPSRVDGRDGAARGGSGGCHTRCNLASGYGGWHSRCTLASGYEGSVVGVSDKRQIQRDDIDTMLWVLRIHGTFRRVPPPPVIAEHIYVYRSS